MAFECVVVKEEFDLNEDVNTEVSPAQEKNEPECNKINNKVETGALIPGAKRIKQELIDPPSSPDEPSWIVPIEEEKKVVTESYLEVTIKEEVPDSEENESACENPQSPPEGPGVQVEGTSSEDLDCKICGKHFTVYGHLHRHLESHTTNSVQCHICNRPFLNKLRLDTHMFTRHTLTSYSCEHCSEKFKSKYLLKAHKKTHADKKPFQCSKCFRKFTAKRNLERHLQNTCELSEGPFHCKTCNEVFENVTLLKAHMKGHDTERPYDCEECSTAFKHKSTLTRHMHVHTGIRPYPCPHCDKTFTSSGLLKPHLRVHTGEKPYSCKLCDKKFAHKHNMQRHMLGHEKVKHTVCDICHKGFPRESRLKYHMKTHVNEKYFLCKVCPKRFSHKQNVVRHYTRKHPGHTYECTDTDASVAAKVWDTMKKRFCDEETEEILG